MRSNALERISVFGHLYISVFQNSKNMGFTSKKYFDEAFKNKIWKDFLREIGNVKDKNQLVEILGKALTQKEINLLEKRLAVLFLLKSDSPYRKIAKIADVHYNTISFIKKGLKKPVRTPKKYSAMPSKKKKKKEKLI